MQGFVAAKAFPGAVVCVGSKGEMADQFPLGRFTFAKDSSPVTIDTLYDLASLTKVVCTTTLAMILVDRNRLDLDTPLVSLLPDFRGEGKKEVTVGHLLSHSSGLDWWAPLYEELRGKEAYVERIQAMDLVYAPGSQSKYSDLGMILLGEVIERIFGATLDALTQRHVFDSMWMDSTFFCPSAKLLENVAPTEIDPWRGHLLQGEVHDENAHAMGGVAPHAGLFGTALDLARLAQMMLNKGRLGHRQIVYPETVELFTRRVGVPGSSRALGWDTKSAEGSSAGSLFSPRSYGHTGFTGTSLWIDPEREIFVILLTNRVHPSRDNTLIQQVRPALADAVVRALAQQEGCA
jgi:CubicO group peptidase (beta-lactamase class C family)